MADNEQDGQDSQATGEPATPAQDTPSPEPQAASGSEQVNAEGAPELKKKPGPVPYERFSEVIGQKNHLDAELQCEREERIRLEERLRAKETAQRAAQEQTTYKRADLLAGVERGEISQVQADEQWERQLVSAAEERAVARMRQEQSVASSQQTIARELAEYRDVVPDAWVPSSPARQQASQEYQRLVGRLMAAGMPVPAPNTPQAMALEAEALRAAFGPVERIKQAKQDVDLTRTTRDTHREVGGGTVPEHVTSTGKDDPIKNLRAKERTWYERKIEQRVYKGWDEVRNELTYKNPRIPKVQQLA